MKICDLTQFYSPLSGGVKRYLHEKIAYIQQHSLGDEHVLIVPGERTEVMQGERSRVYAIRSPLVSRTTRYRVLLNLRAIDEVIAREQPDIIESADPYQLGWAAAKIGARRRIPVVAFYHSDFAEAYVRPVLERVGSRVAETAMRAAASYTRALYNRFAATFVPSVPVAARLQQQGVRNIHQLDLGVNTLVFAPAPDDAALTREANHIPPDRTLLLYVGRLAPEKNTSTLFAAVELLARHYPDRFHLLVIGDGQEREQLRAVEASTGAVTWLPYCADSHELARFYRAADIFVHPGTQETFGLASLEAQACGTPVVGIRGSAMDRIILHEQSFWAAANTPSALAHAIVEASARDLRSLGKTAAAAVAQQYAWPRIFDGLFCIYREVCANYREPTAV